MLFSIHMCGGGAYIACAIIAAFSTYKTFQEAGAPCSVMIDEREKIIKGTSNSDIFIVCENTEWISYYVVSSLRPQIKHFIPPLIPNGKDIYYKEVLHYIHTSHPNWILVSAKAEQQFLKVMQKAGVQYSPFLVTHPDADEPALLYKKDSFPPPVHTT